MAVLAESVERYKASYGVAVRAARGLQADIEKGKERADRASRLVASLRSGRSAEHEAEAFLTLSKRYRASV